MNDEQTRAVAVTPERFLELLVENERLRAELSKIKADMEEAAGELMIPIPVHGTDVAKLLHANVMMRQYHIPELRDRAEETVGKLRHENERLRAERDNLICVIASECRDKFGDSLRASDVTDLVDIPIDTVRLALGAKPDTPEPTPEGACPSCKSVNIKHYRSGVWFVNQCSNCGYASGFAK